MCDEGGARGESIAKNFPVILKWFGFINLKPYLCTEHIRNV